MVVNMDEAPVRQLKRKESGEGFIGFIQSLEWTRIATWVFVSAMCYYLKDFYGIAMGTFVMSYAGNSFVTSATHSAIFPDWLDNRVRRRLLVLVFFTAILALVSSFGVLTIPHVVREGADFINRLKNDGIWMVVLQKMRLGLGDVLMEQLERFLKMASSDDIINITLSTRSEWSQERMLAMAKTLKLLLRSYTDAAVGFTSTLLKLVTSFVLQTGVSLVLSFMCVWDLPTIARGLLTLKKSRLRPVYDELGPSMRVFGNLFGKAMQAQAQVAAVNTGLTALGMWALHLPGIGLLSLFVFICGFIPIAGVFISTVPIGFVALTEYGFRQLALVIVLVFVVHMIEGYVLNPAIYSAHLKLHPLLVLMVLVLAEHFLGIWGLLLAVPLTVFTVDYVIRYPLSSVRAVAEKELEQVCHADGASGEDWQC